MTGVPRRLRSARHSLRCLLACSLSMVMQYLVRTRHQDHIIIHFTHHCCVVSAAHSLKHIFLPTYQLITGCDCAIRNQKAKLGRYNIIKICSLTLYSVRSFPIWERPKPSPITTVYSHHALLIGLLLLICTVLPAVFLPPTFALPWSE